MSNEHQLAKIIAFIREIESILKEKFQAQGKGLHSYLDSIESKLDSGLVRDLRYLATMRNKSMHENTFQVENFSRYETVAKKSIQALKDMTISIERKTVRLTRERPRRREKTTKKNSFFKNVRNIIYILVFLFLIFNVKLIGFFLSDMFDNPTQNVKQEHNLVIEDVLDEDGEIKDIAYRHVLKEVVPDNRKEIRNVIYVSPKYSFRCTGKEYCSQMSSCAEATFYINNCPNTKMDGDGDGIPCWKQWCGR